MKANDAPERIYTTGTKASGSWNAETASTARIKLDETEYIRADIHQAALAGEYRKGFDDGCAHIKEDYQAGKRIDLKAALQAAEMVAAKSVTLKESKDG